MSRSIYIGIAVAVFAFSLLLLPGTLQRIKVNTTSNRTLEIDAGIIFRDRSSYQCFFLSDLGLADENDLQILNSSCDCLHATLVQVPVSQQQLARAILLEFRSEPIEPSSRDLNGSLAVILNMKSRSNESIEVVVKFLHTSSEAL